MNALENSSLEWWRTSRRKSARAGLREKEHPRKQPHRPYYSLADYQRWIDDKHEGSLLPRLTIDFDWAQTIRIVAKAPKRKVFHDDGWDKWRKHSELEILYAGRWVHVYKTDLTDDVGICADYEEALWLSKQIIYGARLKEHSFGLITHYSDG